MAIYVRNNAKPTLPGVSDILKKCNKFCSVRHFSRLRFRAKRFSVEKVLRRFKNKNGVFEKFVQVLSMKSNEKCS